MIASTIQILDFDMNNCNISKKQWALIKWYFERCTFIEITEIALNQSRPSDFSNQIIGGLMNGNLNDNEVSFVLTILFV